MNSSRSPATHWHRALSTQDADEWRAYLPASDNVFGSVELALVTERHLDCQARLFVFRHGAETVVSPILLRPINRLPFANAACHDGWDAATPDYTGPLARQPVSRAASSGFLRHLAAYCDAERIVTLFGHLHPWNWSASLLEAGGLSLNREIVYVDLTLPDEQIWRKSLTRICRKNVKRARRDGVRVFQAERAADIEQFYRVYIATVRRRQLPARYDLSVGYFADIWQTMPHNARFTLADYQGRVIAGELCLYDAEDVYACRCGMDYTYQAVNPVNALLYEAILWGKRQGKKRLVLGGGARPNDGIFRFNADFSPLRAKFYVYRGINRPDDYAALCQEWSRYYGRSPEGDGYFPVYRSVPSGGPPPAPGERQSQARPG